MAQTQREEAVGLNSKRKEVAEAEEAEAEEAEAEEAAAEEAEEEAANTTAGRRLLGLSNQTPPEGRQTSGIQAFRQLPADSASRGMTTTLSFAPLLPIMCRISTLGPSSAVLRSRSRPSRISSLLSRQNCRLRISVPISHQADTHPGQPLL